MTGFTDQRADRFGPDDFTGPRARQRRGEFPFGEGARHHGGGRRGFGPGGPPFGPGFGPGGPGGPRGGRGFGRGPRGGRAGRGDVRAAILLLLVDAPMHGYQIIQEISERSGGAWKPSPGAVYPALNLLQDEGLVQIASEGGRRMAALTEEGRTYVTEHADELGDPWQDAAGRGGHGRHRDVRDAMGAVAGALHQVFQTGTEEQVDEAVRILDRTRRELYLVLAGPAPDGTEDDVEDQPVEDEPIQD